MIDVDDNPYPTVMSNMLEPTELDTAISPKPFLATMTLVMRSGMEVPAARIVRPMISSVMPTVSPTCSVIQKIQNSQDKHIRGMLQCMKPLCAHEDV